MRGSVPDEVFTTPYENPVGGDPPKMRDNLSKAVELFAQAGWVLKGNKMVNEKTGEPFTIEYLYADPNFDRVVLPYQQNLRASA